MNNITIFQKKNIYNLLILHYLDGDHLRLAAHGSAVREELQVGALGFVEDGFIDALDVLVKLCVQFKEP